MPLARTFIFAMNNSLIQHTVIKMIVKKFVIKKRNFANEMKTNTELTMYYVLQAQRPLPLHKMSLTQGKIFSTGCLESCKYIVWPFCQFAEICKSLLTTFFVFSFKFEETLLAN